MTTQTQGKGKKKNKDVMKVSLDEFNQIDAPHGHSVVSLKTTGLDWAAAMADYDQKAIETQQIIVPAAPRAQRGPDVDFDSLPNEPPFRVSLFNLPMSVEEKEIHDRFFQGINVKRVEISKSSTTVELDSKDALYEALCKDGTNIKGRTVNVCLYGQSPQNNYSDRYGGGRGGNSYGDRYGDRSQGGGFGARSNDRYGDRSSGFSRGGFGQARSSYGDREGYQSRDGFQSRGSNYKDEMAPMPGSGEGVSESDEQLDWRARPASKPTPSAAPMSTYDEPSTYSQPNTYSDRYGGSRGGNFGDRYGDSTQGGGGYAARSNDRYGDRPSGGFNRGAGGGFGQSRAGFGYGSREGYQPRGGNFRSTNRSRYTSGGGEPEQEDLNWRARPSDKPTPAASVSPNNVDSN